jgi:GH15 family glucan-1,4-alpha-glucosidase
MNIPSPVSCRVRPNVSQRPTSTGTRKEAYAKSFAEKAQSEQDKLMNLYALSGQGFNSTLAAEWSRKLGREVNEGNWEAVLRGQIEAQGQKVNSAYQTMTAVQNILKNIHDMIMALIRNLRLQ